MNLRIKNLEYFKKWLVLGILIGVAAGVGALLFYYAIVYAQDLFLGGIAGVQLPSSVGEGGQPFVQGNMLLVPVSLLLGGLLSGFLVYTFAPEAEGHGTDAMIDAFHNKDGRIRRRVPLIKALASAITIGSGGSAGREGPTAQIAAGIGAYISDMLRLDSRDRRIAVLVGTGAGIGTIFKAPIGGALLAVEVPYKRDFETSALFPAVVASAVGYSIFGSIVGFQPIFGYYLQAFDPLNLPLYAVLGIVTGLFVIFYVGVFYRVQEAFRKLRIKNHIKPFLGAIVVAAIAMLFPEVMGVGYGWVQIFFNATTQNLPTYGIPLILIIVLMPFAKIFATSFSISSGGSGGVFAPGIFIGASIGLMFGLLFHSVSPGIATSIAPFVIVGALAFMGAAGKVPISVLLMVTEMTGSMQLLPAAMVAVALSYLVSGDRTIYKSQVPTRRDSPVHMNEYSTPMLESIKISDLILEDISVRTTSSPGNAKRQMMELGVHRLPVVSGEHVRRLLGGISMEDLERARSGGSIAKLRLAKIAHVGYGDSARKAFMVMAKNDSVWAPVLKDGTYVGTITLERLSAEYNRRFKKARVVPSSHYR